MTGNGTQGKGDEAAQEFQARIDQASKQINDELADIRLQLLELRNDLALRAASAKERVAGELKAAAARVRQEGQKNEDTEAVQRMSDLADRLDATAAYLDEHSLEEIGDEVTLKAQANVWQVVGIAFLIGLILGFLLGSGKRR